MSVCFEEKPSGTKEMINQKSFFFQNRVKVYILKFLYQFIVLQCICTFCKFKGFKVAYVVYNNASSLKEAMKLEWGTIVISTEEKPIKSGLESNLNTILNLDMLI